MALNAKQKLFVKFYIQTKSAIEAAKRAGYSKDTAYSSGPRLLTNVGIAKEIQKRLHDVTEAKTLNAVKTAADVLNEIYKHAFVNLKDAYNEDGTLKNIHDMPEDVQKSITGMESTDMYGGRGDMKKKIGKAHKLKTTDKMKALELAAKHHKLLTDIKEITDPHAPQVVVHLPGNDSEADPEKNGG